MSQPSPEDRLFARLQGVPAACRAIEAAINRARLRGGGEVVIRFHVGVTEACDQVEVAQVFAPHEG